MSKKGKNFKVVSKLRKVQNFRRFYELKIAKNHLKIREAVKPIHDYGKDGGMYIFPGYIANVI